MKVPNSLVGSTIVAFLIPALISLPLYGQVYAQGGESASTAPQIQVHANLQGGAISVQVSDESGAPVADAAVVIRLPDSGETGAFADGTHAAVAYTDASGQAHISGLTWSSGSGAVAVKITATKGTARAGTLLEEQLRSAPAAPEARKSEPVALSPLPVPSGPEPGQVKTAIATASPAITPLPQAAAVPMVTITHGPNNEKVGGSSHVKWYILAAVVVAAGAGAAFAIGGKKSSSSSTSAGTTTIGAPTISVGTP